MTMRRRVIVHITTSADGFIARPDGDLAWLTSHPAPKGFYGMNAFVRSVDTKLLGRRTYEASLALGATFGDKDRHVVLSHRPAPRDAPLGVDFVGGPIRPFIDRLRNQPGKGRHRHVPLELLSTERFENSAVQLHYRMQRPRAAGDV